MGILPALSKLTRANDWRLSFIPFIIGCVYLWLAWFDIRVNLSAIALVLLSLLTSFGFAALGYFINEYFDRKTDKKAGKINKLELLRPIYRLGLLLLIVSVTFLPWIWLPADRWSYGLIGVEIALFLMYSLPFPRIKEVPYISGIVDASYAYVIPLTLSFHTYSLFAKNTNLPLFLPFFLGAIFFAGYRNITIHHINDIFKDMRSGVITLPQKLGPQKTNALLIALFSFEIIFFTLSFVCIGLHLYLFFLWLAFYVLFVVYRLLYFKFNHISPYFSIEPIRHFTDPAYQIWFPLFSLFFAIVNDWQWLLILPIHALVLVPFHFYKRTYISMQWVLQNPVRAMVSFVINYSIYYLFLLVGVNLKKNNTSAVEYLKKNKRNP